MKKQVLIIHGGSVHKNYNQYLTSLKNVRFNFEKLRTKGWKDSLGVKLGAGYEVLMPTMPNPNNARYAEWKIWFDKILPFLNNEIILVGHSLGGIFLVKYLSENKCQHQIDGVFLIAAPFEENKEGGHLMDFKLPKNLTSLTNQTRSIFMYHSSDDPVVPITDLEKYHQLLPKAIMRIFKNRQHFNQLTFPELVRDIKLLKK